MSVRCPLGHLSATDDWCDECGARIEAAANIGGAPDGGGAGGATQVATTPLPADGTAAPSSRPPLGWVTGPWPVPRPAADERLLGAGGQPGPPVAGVPLAGTPSATPAGPGPSPAAAAAGPMPPEKICPLCETPREPGQRFCEECGYDYVTRTAPPGWVRPSPRGPTQPTPPPAPPSVPPRQDPPVGVSAAWLAEIVPDRAYFDRGDDGSAPFPADTPPRLVALLGNRTLIGRRSRSRGIFPEIDLSLPPEDIGISRTHALLEHPAGRPLTIIDLGSANGTWLGDGLRRVERGVAVELADGAHIYLGSWTRITLRAR